MENPGRSGKIKFKLESPGKTTNHINFRKSYFPNVHLLLLFRHVNCNSAYL